MRIDWIDFARAVAIIGVIIVHLSQVLSMPQWALLAASFGAMGVQLFFLISAYCLAMTWNEQKMTWRWWLRKYYRLASWYIIGIALYWIYHVFVRDGLTANYTMGNITANILLVNGFVPSAQNSIVPGGWSISCIALFVFAWPILRKFHAMTLVVIGVAGCVVSAVGYLYFGWSRFFTYCSPFNQFIVFALGVCLFRYRNRIKISWAIVMAIAFFALSVLVVVCWREYNILCRHIFMALSFCGSLLVLMRSDR